MVEKIESEVIAKHNMNRADYEASFTARVAAVPELKAIEDYMVKTMNQAGTGNITLPNAEIPAVLTPQKVFELLVNSEKGKIQKIAAVFADYIRAGSMPNEQDPAFNMKMEQAMGENIEIPGLKDLEFEESEHHPLSLFIKAQTVYTQKNEAGFKTALQQFMQSIQVNTGALATGQLNASNIDAFMAKLEGLGEADIKRFTEKANPTPVIVEETPAETTETPAETTETPAEETTETPAEETTETPAEETTETPAEENAEEATPEEEGDAAIQEE
jgi:hypothetical protein